MTKGTTIRCVAAIPSVESNPRVSEEASPAGSPDALLNPESSAAPEESVMSGFDKAYVIVLVVVLTTAVLATFATLGHALQGFQLFW